MTHVFRIGSTLALALLVGCGDTGSYELTWTLGCDKLGEPACRITSVAQCSSVGIDTVAVIASRGEEVTRTLFPCYSAKGSLARGPGLGGGPTELTVTGLSAGAQSVTDPVTVTVTIPDSDFVAATVDLPLPLACRDGVDNDGDGAADLLDPGCSGSDDDDESDG